MGTDSIEIARVGLNESDGKAKGESDEVTRYGLDVLDWAIADEAAHGLVKVLTVPGKDKTLGATIVGDHAADTLIEFILAMRHGIGLNEILGTILPTPAGQRRTSGSRAIAKARMRRHGC